MEDGAEIVILDCSDGCAAQYRSGTSLYMLNKLACERNIVYCRAINAENHGKKSIDGLSGRDKAHLTKEFRGNTHHVPEAVKEGKKSYLIYDVKAGGGVREDLANLCCEILSDPSRKSGAEKGPTNKNSGEERKSETAISSRHYEKRKVGVAKFEGLSMEVKGFKAGTRNGIKFHYGFRLDPALEQDKLAFTRFPCECGACYEQF